MKRPQIRLSTLRKEQKKLDRAQVLVANEIHDAILAGKMRRWRALSYIMLQLERRQDFIDFGYLAYKTKRRCAPSDSNGQPCP